MRTSKGARDRTAAFLAKAERLLRWSERAQRFVGWYNTEHRHSAIRYVSPAQRYAGQDAALLAARHELYQKARAKNPQRWSGNTRNWNPIGPVTLNPERDCMVHAFTQSEPTQRRVA